MFKLDGNYFGDTKCPNNSEEKPCTILNCLFSHRIDDLKRPLDGDPELPAPKRAETEAKGSILQEQRDEEGYRLVPKPITHLDIPFEIRHANIQRILEYYGDEELKKSEQDALEEEFSFADLSQSKDEYNSNIELMLLGKEIKVISDPAYILPKEVKPKAPAGLPERKRFIQFMVDAFKKAQPNVRTPILKSIEEEYTVASTTTPVTYNQSIKKKIHQIANPEKYQRKEKVLSNADLLSKLKELVIPKPKLQKFGYVMEPPKTKALETRRNCRRCGADFTKEEQLNPVTCQFHAGKIRRKDKRTRFYDCCGSEVGSENETCSVASHHIFYWNDVEEMHSAIPFKKIDHSSKTAVKAVGIDCEMGYTTLGFELLRITAIDYLTGEDVFDIFVQPIGTVVDLNTRYSGVAEIIEGALTFEELMHFVRQYIDKDTVLIGHGLENDMNAMRLIHEQIVDTAILYPKFKASPTFRFSLKDLAFSYLSRNIQTGEHDSREDSIAAIDIVKYFINLDAKRDS
ncbi:uncharacterized protein CANTADRAFT_69368 [Suhomyces tanzawaensis NRRL Y-17324]|uniref:RNA exonuclease 3 n=1 Tax=Suhomyces tanzawaensis NRRL Y-17324 TaxID=984487 RepID=A0A1E4SES3_9ASCO|nr:uncharacterized protein CANTADRAFT_69368 [Suhomyces tanzawaensis NRRL Y-17324]ODV77980.1 hypothetical protein CANTADRAFT_69368 [Suhomyces tanzawaensis NRRL Y-17324]